MKYGEKWLSIWRIEFLHPAMWKDHNIDFARWLHPAMWHVALESWQWIHQVAAPCKVTRSSGIMTLNAPGCSTLQCDKWLWDDMPLNSPKRPPYWNPTSCYNFDHITIVDRSFCTSLQNFIQIGPSSAEKMTSCQFSRWRISTILDFRDTIMGSLKSPCTTSYRSSIKTIALNCLVFKKIVFFLHFGDRQTDRLINKQMDSIDALSRLAVVNGGLKN